MSKHTPTPWEVVEHAGVGSRWYTILRGAIDVGPRSALMPEVAHTQFSGMHPDEDKANAKHIVHCVNNYYELLRGCKLALRAFEENIAIDWDEIASIIAKAEKNETP